MNTLKCEVLVVGAGPAGGMAAKSCAEKGIDTILIEKKPEIGAPLRCAEGVSKKMFKEIGVEPKPEWIRADMKGAVIRSPDGTSFQLDESKANSMRVKLVQRSVTSSRGICSTKVSASSPPRRGPSSTCAPG